MRKLGAAANPARTDPPGLLPPNNRDPQSDKETRH
jgi:hypothetical protein